MYIHAGIQYCTNLKILKGFQISISSTYLTMKINNKMTELYNKMYIQMVNLLHLAFETINRNEI